MLLAAHPAKTRASCEKAFSSATAIRRDRLYRESFNIPEILSGIDGSRLVAVLSSARGASLYPFWRPSLPPAVASQGLGAAEGFEKFMNSILKYKIREKREGKGYNLSVHQAVCISQTDPEPEAREQAMIALDEVVGQQEFRRQVFPGMRGLLVLRDDEEVVYGAKSLDPEGDFNGHPEVALAVATALSQGGTGLYKRVLRIRKQVFIRSKEGVRFGWGDRLSLGAPSTSGQGPEFEEAFRMVATSMISAAPPLALLLARLLAENRVEVRLSKHRSRLSAECPYEPSPVGVQVEGFGYTSPLTGTLISFSYNRDAGAPGLAQFLWRKLMEAKLQELNPLMASFPYIASASVRSSSSLRRRLKSSGSRTRSSRSIYGSSQGVKSILSATNSLLIEAVALWGHHLAFKEQVNVVFNPQQQLRLILSYLDETLGRVVKGSLRAVFGKRLRSWARSNKDGSELERQWLRVFKDHFGSEGDVFDTFVGVRSQWLLFDAIEEVVGYKGSNTSETLGYRSSPATPVQILSFMALNKVANECHFIKDFKKLKKDRKPTQELLSEAFNTFVAEAEKFGFVEALRARGADTADSRFWKAVFHDAFDKLIIEAEMLAQELSYFSSNKVKSSSALGLN